MVIDWFRFILLHYEGCFGCIEYMYIVTEIFTYEM